MSTTPPAPLAEIVSGKISGERRANVLAFHAIPYAAPPIGALRFAPPQPAHSWSGIRDCSQRGSSPPQGPSRLDAVMGISQFSQNEDCLTVSVWTPATDGGKRPVFVWLHGGAYQSGGGNQVFYDGGNLAAAGEMVVVSVNYRLGALGYLYFPGASAQDNVAPANRGLLDQIAALEWVRNNIAAFGGDPGNVTLAGQSAGGGSAVALLSIAHARTLFHRAILQSAPAVTLDKEKAAAFSARWHEIIGVRPGDFAALRALPAAEIVAAQRKLQMEIATRDARSIAFQMVSGVAPLAGKPADVFESGEARHIPLLIGSTLDEGHAWYAQDEKLLSEDNLGVILDIARNAFNEDGSGLPAGRRSKAERPWELLSAILTWSVFEKTVLRYADAHLAHGGAAWTFRFDWRPTADARFGACHCIEIPFMFANRDYWPPAEMLAGAPESNLDELARAMSSAWINFAHHGDPQAPCLPQWQRWSGQQKPMMVFNEKLYVEPAPSI